MIMNYKQRMILWFKIHHNVPERKEENTLNLKSGQSVS